MMMISRLFVRATPSGRSFCTAPPKTQPKRKAKVSRRALPKHNYNLGPFYAAIVGRPNVGKSTVYNKLIRHQDALVSTVAGTTRDRKEGKAQMGDLHFTICDTGGFENLRHKGRMRPTEMLAPEHGGDLVDSMHLQTAQGIRQADVVMLIVDALDGITPDDLDFARWIQKQRESVLKVEGLSGLILLANKTDSMFGGHQWGLGNPQWTDFIGECYRLGFGDPIPISAEHAHGFGDIHNALLPYAIASGEKLLAEAAREEKEEQKMIQISFCGRPNTGKSTLTNAILGEERCITGPVPGLTRDAVAIDWVFEGRNIRLVDTAGIRRRTRLHGANASTQKLQKELKTLSKDADTKGNTPRHNRKIAATLEDLSIKNSLKALDRAMVVTVVVDVMAQADDPDASGCLTKHDLSIIGRVLEEGRAVVIAANKCDLSGKDWETAYHDDVIEWVRYHIEDTIPSAHELPVVPMSALNKQGVEKLMPAVLECYDRWRKRIPTAILNQWVYDAQLRHRPPSSRGATYRQRRTQSGKLKIKYVTQVTTRPPTFVMFVNRGNPGSDIFPDSYVRYLTNSLRKTFGFQGVPIRLFVRGSGAKHLEGMKHKRRTSRRNNSLGINVDEENQDEEKDDDFEEDDDENYGTMASV